MKEATTGRKGLLQDKTAVVTGATEQGIAEVELIVEVDPIHRDVLGKGRRKLQRKSFRHAALQLHE